MVRKLENETQKWGLKTGRAAVTARQNREGEEASVDEHRAWPREMNYSWEDAVMTVGTTTTDSECGIHFADSTGRAGED